jgi:hypothetical protein
MRKFLIAVSLIAGFSFVADTASARARIGRIVSSKPAAVKVAPKSAAAKVAERTAPPRTWIVATPRPASTPAVAAPAALADMPAQEPAGPFAAASSIPNAADPPASTPTSDKKSASPSAEGAAAPDAQTRMAGLEKPAPNLARVGYAQPHKFVVCYWNRAGQCVR